VKRTIEIAAEAKGRSGYYRACAAQIEQLPLSSEVTLDFLSKRGTWPAAARVDLRPQDAVALGEALLEVGQLALDTSQANEEGAS
jgi:hypothetical protein